MLNPKSYRRSNNWHRPGHCIQPRAAVTCLGRCGHCWLACGPAPWCSWYKGVPRSNIKVEGGSRLPNCSVLHIKCHLHGSPLSFPDTPVINTMKNRQTRNVFLSILLWQLMSCHPIVRYSYITSHAVTLPSPQISIQIILTLPMILNTLMLWLEFTAPNGQSS